MVSTMFCHNARKLGVGVIASFALLSMGLLAPTTASAGPDDLVKLTWTVYGAWDNTKTPGGSVNTENNRLGAEGAVLVLVRNNTGVELGGDGSPYTCVVDKDGKCEFNVPESALGTALGSTSSTRRLTVKVADESKDTWSIPPALIPNFLSIPNPVVTDLQASAVQLQLANPLLPAGTCIKTGLKVAIVADLSQSMLTNNAIGRLKENANEFIHALIGTSSEVALFTFATTSPAESSTGTTNNDNKPSPRPVKNEADYLALKADVDKWEARSGAFTNWDAAMRALAAAPTTFDLVLFITDGDPNRIVRTSTSAPATTDMATANVASANAVKAKGSRILVMYVGTPTDLNALRARIVEISGPVGDASDILRSDYVTTSTWDGFSEKLADLLAACQRIDVLYVDETLGYITVPITPAIEFPKSVVGQEVIFTDAIAEAHVPAGYRLVKVPYSFEAGDIDYVDKGVWQLDREDSLTEFTLAVAADPMVIYVILEHIVERTPIRIDCTIKYQFKSEDGEITGEMVFPDNTALYANWFKVVDLTDPDDVTYETSADFYRDAKGLNTVLSEPKDGYTHDLDNVFFPIESPQTTEPSCEEIVYYTPAPYKQGTDDPYRGPEASTGGSISTLPLLGQSAGLLAILAGAVMLIRRRVIV